VFPTPLQPGDLPASTSALARALVGCIVVREEREGRTTGRIVETEAYRPGDSAAHAFGGKRVANASLFLPAFHAYVYLSHGVAWCFNVVAERGDVGAGVLIRALEPLEGIERMRARRDGASLRDLCRGPGRLSLALDIDRRLDGAYLLSHGPLWLAAPDRPARRVRAGPRIGLTRAVALRARYYESGSRYLSGPAKMSP
jgi:DNA-3-methyladenine glycosylase